MSTGCRNLDGDSRVYAAFSSVWGDSNNLYRRYSPTFPKFVSRTTVRGELSCTELSGKKCRSVWDALLFSLLIMPLVISSVVNVVALTILLHAPFIPATRNSLRENPHGFPSWLSFFGVSDVGNNLQATHPRGRISHQGGMCCMFGLMIRFIS
jgi:hypothetical protein